MRIIQTPVYKYDELSEPAQAKARDWYREMDANSGDHFWAEPVIEDAVRMARILGIDITAKDIHYSGFSSQGDGAQFEGRYAYQPDAIAAIKAEAPKDEALHEIAEDLELVQRPYNRQLTATVTPLGHYSHAYANTIDVEYQGDDERDLKSHDIDEVKAALRAFMNWIYEQLRDAYEHDQSDEQVAENIRANEYEFTATGRRFA